MKKSELKDILIEMLIDRVGELENYVEFVDRSDFEALHDIVNNINLRLATVENPSLSDG